MREVHRTLHSVEVATSIGATALFDRNVDSTILSLCGFPVLHAERQALGVGSLNLALPYLHGVPPDRLLELRNRMPAPFLEFRSHLAEIVSRATKQDPENATELARLIADRELVPAVRGDSRRK